MSAVQIHKAEGTLVTYSSGLREHSAKVLFIGSNPIVTSKYMVAVAQLAEHQVVALNVARSIRVGYPSISQEKS